MVAPQQRTWSSTTTQLVLPWLRSWQLSSDVTAVDMRRKRVVNHMQSACSHTRTRSSLPTQCGISSACVCRSSRKFRGYPSPVPMICREWRHFLWRKLRAECLSSTAHSLVPPSKNELFALLAPLRQSNICTTALDIPWVPGPPAPSSLSSSCRLDLCGDACVSPRATSFDLSRRRRPTVKATARIPKPPFAQFHGPPWHL